MKKTLLFLFLLASFQGFSQTNAYHPFPDSNAVWINGYYTLNWTPPLPMYQLQGVTNYCMDGSDTLINATTYTKINYCDSVYKGALRDAGGEVYFVPKDSLQEFLLYDFTLGVGDTIDQFYFEGYGGYPNMSQGDIIINQIDSVDINGSYHKKFNVEGNWWIEGIGCSQGLFAEPYINVSNYQVDLICMSNNDTTLHPQFALSGCEPLVIGIAEKPVESFTLYPNPASTTLSINSSLPFKNPEIKIMNAQAQQVYFTILNDDILDITTLSAGIYYLSIFDGKQQLSSRFIKE